MGVRLVYIVCRVYFYKKFVVLEIVESLELVLVEVTIRVRVVLP